MRRCLALALAAALAACGDDGGGVSEAYCDAAEEAAELERRQRLYRGDRPFPDLADKVVIVVDDGLATGATMNAAVAAVRARAPAAISVAVPVGSLRACDALEPLVDGLVCLLAPRSFHAVGQVYGDFGQTTDEEVRSALRGIPRAL